MLPPTVSEQAGHDPLTPEQAVDRLEELYTAAVVALRAALERFLASGAPPDGKERLRFTYPELRLTYDPSGRPPANSRRAWAKFQSPGTYAVSVTQPGHFRTYLLEQLRHLAADFGPVIEVGPSHKRSPTPTPSRAGDTFDGNTTSGATSRGISRALRSPMSGTKWPMASGHREPGRPQPLALFDAVRVDYSLRRLVHYTGTNWRACPALDSADQLSPLRRPIRPLGSGRVGFGGQAPMSGSCCRAVLGRVR